MRPFDRRLLARASAARGYLIATVAFGLAATALILVQAGLLARALASAAGGRPAAALAGTLTALLLVVAGRAVISYGGEVAALRAASGVKSQLRLALAAHALRLGPSWLAGQQTGEIAATATSGLDALDSYFARYLPQLMLACLVPVAVLARVAAADWISAVVIAVTVPIIPLFAVLVGLHTRAQTQRRWELLARLAGHFLDVVEGLPTLKLFGRSKPQAQVIAQVTEQHRAATMRTLRTAFLSSLVLELAATLATAVVAVEVGLRLLGGHLGYQTALLVLLLTPEAYIPLRAVGLHFHASQEGAAAAGRVLRILDTPASQPPAAVPARPGTMPAGVDLRKDTISFHAIRLAYPGRDRPALSGVELTVRPGERVAITGPSGAGKSSLLALILRLTEPTAGRIEAGGADIASIPAQLWRQQIAWVPQHPYLFAGTVAQNIALGQPGASRAQIERAAALAGAADMIAGLAGGYDTQLGERGCRLSSGQRQRIALARAFLRDAPLLLLDEPASHLDRQAARELSAVIARLMSGRTVIEVTHDLDLASFPDRVLTLANGRLCEHTAPAPSAGGQAAVPALAAAEPLVTRP
ncbi:MAG TPA: thiol reductant ABC exporter subunit CydD [Streptosporangiaceae bacterium]|nr:thiol reductant ABC exporter subunit CydD [Streptosporangiaceae bacterium]